MSIESRSIKTGDVRRFDYQADILEQEFVVLGPVEGERNVYEIEVLPISDERLAELEAIEWIDDELILRGIEQAGYRTSIRFVSAAEYARHF